MPRSESQRAADARYEKKRRAPLAVRLTEEQWRWLEAQTRPGEKPAHATLRLAGAPGAPPNEVVADRTNDGLDVILYGLESSSSDED